MRRFRGSRTEFGCEVTLDGRHIDPRLDLCRSAAGYGWGAPGEGADNLALAICSAALGRSPESDARARRVHRVVAQTMVSHLAHDSWFLTDREVAVAIREAENEIAAREAVTRGATSGRPTGRSDGVRCPTEPVGPRDRGGCGSVEVSGPYDGGLYRCRRCGLRFTADANPEQQGEDAHRSQAAADLVDPPRPAPSPTSPSNATAKRVAKSAKRRADDGLLGPDPGGPYPRWWMPTYGAMVDLKQRQDEWDRPWDPEAKWREAQWRMRHPIRASWRWLAAMGRWIAALMGALRPGRR